MTLSLLSPSQVYGIRRRRREEAESVCVCGRAAHAEAALPDRPTVGGKTTGNVCIYLLFSIILLFNLRKRLKSRCPAALIFPAILWRYSDSWFSHPVATGH